MDTLILYTIFFLSFLACQEFCKVKLFVQTHGSSPSFLYTSPVMVTFTLINS